MPLSRGSNAFRAMFIDKSFRGLWIVTRRALEMPDLLPQISEPRYAAAPFEYNCIACGVNR